MNDDLVDVGWAVLVKAINDLDPKERAEVKANIAAQQDAYIDVVIHALKGDMGFSTDEIFEDMAWLGFVEDLKNSIADPEWNEATTLVSAKSLN